MVKPANAQPKNFGFNADEIALRDVAEKFFHENLTSDTLHQIVAADSDPANGDQCCWDRSLWKKITDLGWLTVAIPEAAGGLGMSAVATAALVEQAGRAALPAPLATTLNAIYLLAACQSHQATTALGNISEGASCTYAGSNRHGAWDADSSEIVLENNQLNGNAWFVQDVQKVDHFVVNAKHEGEPVLLWINAQQEGVRIAADAIVDLTRDQGRVTFTNVPVDTAQIVADASQARFALNAATPAQLVLVAADMCGAAEWQLQTTADYARTRKQFDHNIGFFQAVKHPLVEFMVALDLARSHLYNAACAIDHDPASAEIYARMAKAAANDAAGFGSKKSVQLHGGIGFTWECYIHIYMKRQLHSQMLLGDAAYQRARLADLLAGPVAA